MSEFEIDEDWETDISIWIATSKTTEEFLASFSQVIEPVKIKNGTLNIGGIEILVREVSQQPRLYNGVPKDNYTYEVLVSTTQGLIWGCFDKKVVYAITLGLRSKFVCSYLVTTNSDDFLFYSGTNKPYYINLNYQSCIDGELLPVAKDGWEIIELRI